MIKRLIALEEKDFQTPHTDPKLLEAHRSLDLTTPVNTAEILGGST
jgi:hypothetical protein